MDNKKKLTDDELDEVAGGFGGGLLPEDMFRQVG
jgi:bacteriocin-like protein